MTSPPPTPPSPPPSFSNNPPEIHIFPVLAINSGPSSPSPSRSLAALISSSDDRFPIIPPARATPSACAACKHQRRKCGPKCPLSEYFPASRQSQFLNVHRLFGVSNVVKTLKYVKEEERHAAADSLIFEAEARAKDPVGGCFKFVLQLEKQLEDLTAEITTVKSQLDYFQTETEKDLNRGFESFDNLHQIGNEGEAGSSFLNLMLGKEDAKKIERNNDSSCSSSNVKKMIGSDIDHDNRNDVQGVQRLCVDYFSSLRRDKSNDSIGSSSIGSTSNVVDVENGHDVINRKRDREEIEESGKENESSSYRAAKLKKKER